MRITYNHGLHFPEIDLWMDSRVPRPVCLISHAHADHLGRHKRIVATPGTARLCRHRMGARPTLAIPFLERREMDGYALTFYPAGHCLGSAQALVEVGGERVVYTGDFKLRESRTSERPVVVACDTLVMDTTFGDPRYVFPPLEEVVGMLREEIDAAFAAGETPVVAGYSLGKSQEALALLVESGYRVAVHAEVHAVVEIYRECGVAFDGPGSFEKLDARRIPENAVLLVPPSGLRQPFVQKIERKRTLYLTGWAMRGSRFRPGVDRMIPLSDHAGYDDLLRYVEASGARRVATLYGNPKFARTISRELGVEACYLGEGATFGAAQMSLF